MSDYEDMTVAQLKELLKEAGLPVSGKKADLIARLQEGAEDSAPAEEESQRKNLSRKMTTMQITTMMKIGMTMMISVKSTLQDRSQFSQKR